MIFIADSALPPLWQCPECGRSFANRNQSHTCAQLDLAHHFENKPRQIREIYDAFVNAIQSIGPVLVLPEKTRIAFQVRMSFAQVSPRRSWINGHLVLSRRLEHPRFRRIDTISPLNHVHHFRLNSEVEIDGQFLEWLKEAYAVGAQRHLKRAVHKGPAA